MSWFLTTQIEILRAPRLFTLTPPTKNRLYEVLVTPKRSFAPALHFRRVPSWHQIMYLIEITVPQKLASLLLCLIVRQSGYWSPPSLLHVRGTLWVKTYPSHTSFAGRGKTPGLQPAREIKVKSSVTEIRLWNRFKQCVCVKSQLYIVLPWPKSEVLPK